MELQIQTVLPLETLRMAASPLQENPMILVPGPQPTLTVRKPPLLLLLLMKKKLEAAVDKSTCSPSLI